MTKIRKAIDPLLEHLNPRQKEIIVGRFGIENQKPQTLAAIGKKYDLTRERIRQIENVGLGILKEKIKSNPECQAILAKAQKHLQAAGGVVKEMGMIGELNQNFPDINRNHLALLLDTTRAFNFYPEDKNFWSFYYSNKEKLVELQKMTAQLVKFMRSNKDPVLAGNYTQFQKEFIKEQKLNENYAKNYIAVSKKIHTNPLGDVGLLEWPEIKPVNIKDKIYLVLKKIGKPLHFNEIAAEINKIKFDSRTALSPTVHNELIKDQRFVLVGRGIYGLSEQGYRPGTVQEVIQRILQQSGPMKTKEISLAIAKEKIVKPNTILVNLQNRKFFERLENGAYRIRQD